jgi:hypothetical protein
MGIEQNKSVKKHLKVYKSNGRGKKYSIVEGKS